MKQVLKLGLLVVLCAVGIYGVYLITYKPEVISTEDKIAKVTTMNGSVLRRHFLQSEWLPLKEGMVIFNKDEVKTNIGSSVILSFIKDGNEILLSESTTAEIKNAAIKVNEGSIENNSDGGNPFAIAIGDIQVVFNVRNGSEINLKKGTPVLKIIEKQIEKLDKYKNSTVQNFKQRYKELEKSFQLDKGNALWLDVHNYLEKQRQQKQKVKLSKSADGNIKAQVEEGSVSLEMEGSVGAVEVSEGEGLILDKDSGEAVRVKLLDSPVVHSPINNSKLFNSLELMFSWKAIKGAVTYRISVKTESDSGDGLLLKSSSNVLTWRASSYGQTYSAEVFAIDQYEFEGKKTECMFSILEDRDPPKLEVGEITF